MTVSKAPSECLGWPITPSSSAFGSATTPQPDNKAGELSTITAKKDVPKEKKEWREFQSSHKGGKQQTYAIVDPSVDDIEDAEFAYSIMFNKCIKKGIQSEKKMLEAVNDSGDWTLKEEEDFSKLNIEISTLREELMEIRAKSEYTDEDKNRAKILVEDITKKRTSLMEIRSRRDDFLNHTSESKAQEAQRNYLVYSSTKNISDNKPSTPVWKNYDEYRKDVDMLFKTRAYVEYIGFINDISGDILMSLPENQPNPWDKEKQ